MWVTLCSKDGVSSKIDSIYPLTFLTHKEDKVSKEKLQLCLSKVLYLEHDFSQGSKSLTPDRIWTLTKR